VPTVLMEAMAMGSPGYRSSSRTAIPACSFRRGVRTSSPTHCGDCCRTPRCTRNSNPAAEKR
jgi:hypothetical protein